MFASRVERLSKQLGQEVVPSFEEDDDGEIICEAYKTALFVGGISRLGPLLDSALEAFSLNKIPAEFLFELISSAVDFCTVLEIEQLLWPEIETRVSSLSALTLHSQKQRPQLFLLKLSNDLLRRVVNNFPLSGRILVFVANSLPLFDKSGFNPSGSYFSHITPMELPGKCQDPMFAPFWKLVSAFSRPVGQEIVSDSNLEQFLSVLEKPQSEGLFTTMDAAVRFVPSAANFPLQLRDFRFRCEVLLQCLLFVEHQPPDRSKFKTRILNLLSQAGLNTEWIQAQLVREAGWESWKKEKCVVALPSLVPLSGVEEDMDGVKKKPSFPSGQSSSAQTDSASEDWKSVVHQALLTAKEAEHRPQSSWQHLRFARHTDWNQLVELVQGIVPPLPVREEVEEEEEEAMETIVDTEEVGMETIVESEGMETIGEPEGVETIVEVEESLETIVEIENGVETTGEHDVNEMEDNITTTVKRQKIDMEENGAKEEEEEEGVVVE